MSEIRIRTVSWLVRQIAFSVDREPSLHNVVLEGEVFNFTAHSSGHWYFSLKDEHASIRAIMWENDNLLLFAASMKIFSAQGRGSDPGTWGCENLPGRRHDAAGGTEDGNCRSRGSESKI